MTKSTKYGSGKLVFLDAIFSKTRTNNTKQQQEVLTSKVQVWHWRVVIAVRQQTKGKTLQQLKFSSTKKFEKEKHVGKQILHFDWFAPHIFAIVSSQISNIEPPYPS